MFSHLIVPVDPWSAATSHVNVAADLAAEVGGSCEVITVVERLDDVAEAEEALQRTVEDLGELAVVPTMSVVVDASVAAVLAARLDERPGGMIVIGSHGRGRSAAVFGSTTDEVLRLTFGPVIVVGPQYTGRGGRTGGAYVVPIDGSERADGVLPIVGAWTVEFGGTPWLVEVLDPSVESSTDVSASAFVSRRAQKLHEQIDRPVEFEVLRGDPPGRTIVEHLDSADASLVFMATHGRTGFARLRTGSVAADVVRNAPCPVVLFRPPDLVHET